MSLWISCLENELFTLSNNEILFSDLLQQSDEISKDDPYQIYDPSLFSNYQVHFLTLETKAD
jgi:hypothetical protein